MNDLVSDLLSDGFSFRVAISGAELTHARDAQSIRNYHFNRAMYYLYKSGCRRIRAATPLRPRTSDMEFYDLRGWAA